MSTERGAALNSGIPSLDLLPLLLQHSGFDFSGATFSGEAPNPRTFMGGMSTG